MGPRRARVALIALAAPALVAIVATVAVSALAQQKPAAPRPRAPAHAVAPKKASALADAGPVAAGNFGNAVQAPVAAAPPSSGIDAGVVEAKTTDGGTHVFKFTELDIEGRLKSPQLVYFLRRVRGEFAAGDLGHRSFMREMSETRKESSF
jgi:hypothetical protein